MIDSLPLSEQKAGERLKTRRVPREISVFALKNKKAAVPLKINARVGTPNHPFDDKLYFSDMKKIIAWMIWYLPHGTVKMVRDELNKMEIK